MKFFKPENYRDNLAKDLRGVRNDDPEMARKILKEEQRTTRYDLSLPPSQKEAKRVREEAKEKRINEEESNERLSNILRASYSSEGVERFKNDLTEWGVPLNTEKNVHRVFPDGKMKIGNEIVDTNIYSIQLPFFSSPRNVVITPNDLYIEIVPGRTSDQNSYARRITRVGGFEGEGVSTALMKDGFGIVLENVNLFQENTNPNGELTEEQVLELQEKIHGLLMEHCKKYRYDNEKDSQAAIELHPLPSRCPRDENGDPILEEIFDVKSAKNSKPTPQEYLDNVAETAKLVRKLDSESADILLEREQDKDRYKYAQTLAENRKKLEQEIKGFEHGSFNDHQVGNIDENMMRQIEELGYKTDKDVFVSIGRNNGFELLKAIDKELQSRDGLTVYFVNEYEDTWGSRSDVEVIKLPIPWDDLPFDEIEGVQSGENSISKAIELARKGENVTWHAGGNQQHFYRVIGELQENRSDLLDQWTEYLKENFSRTGLSKKEWTTYDPGFGDTREHSALESNPVQTETLFKEFLKKHNVDIVTTSSKVGDYKQQIPVATDAYHILANKDRFEYQEDEEHGYASDFKAKQKEARDKYGLYSEQITLEILSRPASVLDKSYDFAKEWRDKND